MTSSPQLQDPQLCFSSPVTFIIPSSCLLLSSSPLPVLVEAFSNFCVRQNLGWVGIQQSPSPSKSISYHSYNPSPTSSPQMAQLVGSAWVPPERALIRPLPTSPATTLSSTNFSTRFGKPVPGLTNWGKSSTQIGWNLKLKRNLQCLAFIVFPYL